jgi:hypothetical protein
MSTIPVNFQFTLPEVEHVFLWVSEAFGFNIDEFLIESFTSSAINIQSVNNMLKIYPNRAKSIVTVEAFSEKNVIYDISGRLIDISIDKITNGFKLHTEKLNAGFYFNKVDNSIAKFLRE